jgi:glutamyl-tRNA synthetase
MVSDLIRGDVRFENSSIEDFVLVKGNGAPLYVLANFVDDVDFKISHVVRAEEHLPTTPKAVMLYVARGEQCPIFAHLPVLVNENRLKLSKRRDRVAVEDFRDLGYLPEAMCNYLALLGWSPGGNQEFFTRAQMLESFSFERVGHSPAFFDVVKMTHFNKHYIAAMDSSRFVDLAIKVLERCSWWTPSEERLATLQAIAPLIQERISLMEEVVPMTEFLFRAPSFEPGEEPEFTEADCDVLDAVGETLRGISMWAASEIEGSVRDLAALRETSLRKLQAPVRMALTGQRVGPPLFEAIVLLGKDETIVRLRTAVARASSEG